MFKLDDEVDTLGLGNLTIVRCPTERLYEIFGWPGPDDGHKVSGMYAFTSSEGDVFTVYDWKETYLYYGLGEGFPAPHEFWYDPTPKDLRVGGHKGSDPQPFVDWLLQQVGPFEDPPKERLIRVVSRFPLY